MEADKLCLFHTELVYKIAAIDDEDELWAYILASEEALRKMISDNCRFVTGFFYAYNHSPEHYEKIFRRAVEYYFEGVIYTLALDFCFDAEKVALDYCVRCGFLDHPSSCDVKTSDEIMPLVDEASDEAFYKTYFHLLEPAHVQLIIDAMERNFDKLEKNTREDIDKIKRMKTFCLENEGWNVVYVYDI